MIDTDYTRFVQWYASLAPEGETALIVRQTPRLDADGRIQLHADGAVKATWPSFLPTHKPKDGQAWYGNTASFIPERWLDSRPSASAAACEYVLVMVLDDVGTKSKEAPLPPTWVMETSAGNFQWGYAFSEQPGKDEFAAAIRAIADAGFTDSGACNPVRNFRLPGSVNLKPDRSAFASRLVEFHPDREYTLTEVCAALGVVPGPVDGGGPRALRVADDGGDDVVAWLSEQGMVYSRTNPEGWMGVRCPQADQHTDGSPEGRYMPSARAFCCLHSHCLDLDSAAFLRWVAEQGGPKHAPGLREELLSAVVHGALSKLTPSPALTAEAAAVIAEVERKEAGRLSQKEWFTRYCYVESDDSFFDLVERREVSRKVFDAIYRHVQCFSNFLTQAGKRRQIQASFFFDENRVDCGARSVAGVTYAAGDDMLTARNGLVYVNRWRDGRPAVAPSPAVPLRWMAHLERVIPNKAEREHVLNVMAWKVQNPKRKINHAVLHGGIQGAGKDSAWAPFFWAVGGPTRENVALLENDRLQTQWGYHLESEVIIINELRQVDAMDRRALENRLKSVIAAPPEMLVIERKGLHPYDAPNRTFVVAFSNERGAISLSHDDRRWFVIWTDSPPMTEAEGREFWGWLESGGFEQCAAYLRARDVSAFAPGATPAVTEAKSLMAGASRSLVEDWLLAEINGRSGEFARPVVGSPWGRFCDVLQARAPNGTRVTPTAVLHMLSEAGWTDLGQCHSKTHMTKAHIFAHRTWQGTKAEARDALAAAGAAGPLQLVK